MPNLKRLLFLLKNEPSYIFGRFFFIRKIYSIIKRIENILYNQEIQFGERFSRTTIPINLISSGYVSFDKETRKYSKELRDKSYSLEFILSDNCIKELQIFAKTEDLESNDVFIGNYEKIQNNEDLKNGTAVASVVKSSRNEAIRAIGTDISLYEIVSYFLGYKPKYISSWMYWSIKNNLTEEERIKKGQTIEFHYDIHGYNFIYINFYLTPTNMKNGAHVLVEGSGRRKRWYHLLGSSKLSDEEAIRDYGEQSIRILEGPAGFGFIEDASCYHKALPPLEGDRLMLQLRYQ